MNLKESKSGDTWDYWKTIVFFFVTTQSSLAKEVIFGPICLFVSRISNKISVVVVVFCVYNSASTAPPCGHL